MQAETLVARCRWHSTFDQQEQAVYLQDFLSEWSHSVLKEELNRCFAERCPVHQTWRIETLELDLGDIAHGDLAHDLPHRLRARLHEALDHMLQHAQLPTGLETRPNFRILEAEKTLLETFSWFLKQGGMPWWCQTSGDAGAMLDRLLVEQPQGLAEQLRELGRSTSVRKRVAWQFDDAQLRRVVQVLEPWHAGVVCAYVDQLLIVQARHRVPDVARSEFEKGVWFNTLSCLLVDRGTLFNTVTFTRDMIWRTARLHGIDPVRLLDQMHQAVLSLKASGHIDLTFFTAIETIHQQHPLHPSEALPESAVHDYWPDWHAMLRHGQGRRRIAQDSVSYEALCVALARQDPARLRESLYREGASAVAHEGLLQHVSPSGLALVASVLVPGDHRFIVCHAEHARHLARQRRWDEKVVWRVMLAWLLSSAGSPFNRRQMVRDTLQGICETHGYSLGALLDLLLHSVTVSHVHPHRFELLAILRDLLGEQLGEPLKRDSGVHTGASVWRGLLRYLRNGADNPAGRSVWQRRFAVWLADHHSTPSAHMLVGWPGSTELARANGRALSERLLGLTKAADLPQLFALIDPDAADPCMALLGQLRDGYRLGLLPCLARLDLAFQVPRLMLQALLAFHAGRQGRVVVFDKAAFWQHLMQLFAQQGRVDTDALRRDLRGCLPYDRRWRDVLSDVKQTSDERALPLSLNAPKDALIDSRAQLLLDLARDARVSIDRWIECQPHRYQALAWLTTQRYVPSVERWLLSLLPVELNPPQDTLVPLAKLLIRSGCWQGAEALLDAQLQRLFWAIGFDARARRLSASQWLVRLTLSASLHLDIELTVLLAAWQTHLPMPAGSQWREAYVELLRQPDIESAPATQALNVNEFCQDYAAQYLWHSRLPEIARHLMLHGRPPAWLRSSRAVELGRLLHDLFHLRPDLLGKVLGGIDRQPAALFRLTQTVSFAWLIDALRILLPERQTTLPLIESLHRCMGGLQLPGTTRQQREAVVLEQVLKAAFPNNGAGLELGPLTNDVVVRLMRERRVSPAVLRDALLPLLAQAPEALRQAFQIVTQETDMTIDVLTPSPAEPRPFADAPAADIATRVTNAGMVILNGYFVPLFNRLGFIEHNRFVSEEAQRRAVHYLQFLVTGKTDTAEPHLTLNKLLCGMALNAPIELSIEMTDAEQELCTSLLKAVVSHWPAIGQSSADGLRGNFLVRDGVLRNDKDRWSLHVERRAYDVLLARSPYNYSVIKFPWMEKALYVTWPA